MADAGPALQAARARGLTIAVAESCTGGLLAAALTAPPGASDVFDRGVVTYSNAAKRSLLGVDAHALDHHGAVSEEVARQMADGLMARARADITLSITGVAGPGGSERKPEGRVCFALAGVGDTLVETREFGPLGRDAVRAAAVERALRLLTDAALAIR
ncbi:MAG: CinA family protein [Paracoccaceae bacterium]